MKGISPAAMKVPRMAVRPAKMGNAAESKGYLVRVSGLLQRAQLTKRSIASTKTPLTHIPHPMGQENNNFGQICRTGAGFGCGPGAG